MADKLRIGIIGAGGISQLVHVPIVKKHPNAELVAIADLEMTKAAMIADKFKIPHFYRDPERLLARDDIDAVHVNTPTNSHLAVALAALSAGKHVLIEKPIARKASEAQRMVEAARTANRTLMVAMNLRFRPDCTTLRKLIEAEELGRIITVRSRWLKKTDRWSRSPWLSNARISGGGVLMDLGIQMLDVALWSLGGPAVQRISAHASRDRLGFRVEDTLIAFFSLAGDVSLYLNVTWAFMSDESEAQTIFSGTKGTAILNPLKITKEVQGSLVNVTPAGRPLRPQELYHKSYEGEIDHFYQSLLSGSAPISGGEEAVMLMEIIEATYRAASERREVIPGDDK
ncbi:Gfo/Idh/MocA family oxidoreductase [bacterium]|nr:Gfo/Idh/MocA family oxidoreductase [bacterium]MBU1983554.1 Gfo/Idh/MocA family oxidoreductase [bacterium]